ncbi:MAG: SDR family NAD(P)-dependent oxidoreductase [Proteobacteria bacterium]|nr:SDR family NAD(P)-dependent oxidoreductase [Pseudomonadota bacterium]
MGVLDGRAGVVTGGGRGIGRGHCLHLAEQGASVVVNDIDIDEANAVVDEITKAGGKASANKSDIITRDCAQAHVGSGLHSGRGLGRVGDPHVVLSRY